MRKAWEERFADLVPAAQTAAEDVLIGVYRAKKDRLSHAEIARMIGQKSASGIPAMAAKGEAILERRRKRGSSSS